jgi:hypothetical protein
MDIDLTGGVTDEALDARLDLPEGAEAQPDGSVLLTLSYPRTIRQKRAGMDAHDEIYESLVLHRLTGADVRAVMAASESRAVQVAVAKSLRMRAPDAAVLMDRLDGADFTAVGEVVTALLGMGQPGLPDQVEEVDGTYVLPLREAVDHPDGGGVLELVFKRLTGQDLIEIGRAKDTLPTAIARSTGIKLSSVQTMFDAMDGADVMACNRVIGFLSRNGRKTGR